MLCVNLHVNFALLIYSLLSVLPFSIDVTEVQIFIIVMYVLAAVGGTPFWQFQVRLQALGCCFLS